MPNGRYGPYEWARGGAGGPAGALRDITGLILREGESRREHEGRMKQLDVERALGLEDVAMKRARLGLEIGRAGREEAMQGLSLKEARRKERKAAEIEARRAQPTLFGTRKAFRGNFGTTGDKAWEIAKALVAETYGPDRLVPSTDAEGNDIVKLNVTRGEMGKIAPRIQSALGTEDFGKIEREAGFLLQVLDPTLPEYKQAEELQKYARERLKEKQKQ